MAAKVSTQENELCLEGELTVHRAAELKELFQRALDGADSIEVDLARVTKIDLASLQMFCAALKTASRDGRQWTVKNVAESILRKAGEDAGFNHQLKCGYCRETGCLWRGGAQNG